MREKVDPEIKIYLEEQDAEGGRPFEEQTPEENRRDEDEFLQSLHEGLPEPEMKKVENRVIDAGGISIPIRIYTPPTGKAPHPVIIFFHGGGWVIGSVENRDFRCRTIAEQTESIVVSVNYRLAPEHLFPAAAEDCYAAALWVSKNGASFGGDLSSLSVMGDSAGANLSAVVSLMARDKGEPAVANQLLIYPAVDLYSLEGGSYREFGENHFLTKAAMEYFIELYVPDREERKNPLASPLYADSFSGLPRAYIVTAECDVLRDEGKLYGDKLQAAGTQVDYACFSGMIHGFLEMSTVSQKAQAANRRILSTIKRLIH